MHPNLKKTFAKIFLLLVVLPTFFSVSTVFALTQIEIDQAVIQKLRDSGATQQEIDAKTLELMNSAQGKILTKDPVVKEQTVTTATSIDNSNIAKASPAIDNAAPELSKLDCGMFSGNLGKCIIIYPAYYLFYKFPEILFQTVSVISNSLFEYGLSSSTYKQDNFINPGWVICRDIANTFFIFALLYIAIMTIIGSMTGKAKELLVTIILVALFMNFSLYFTRFVIDVGNIFAIEFYNKFPVEPDHFTIDQKLGNGDTIAQHNISRGISQTLAQSVQTVVGKSIELGMDKNWPLIVFVFIFTGCLLLLFIFAFLAVSFQMIGRIVMLWILMIVSPLAFFSNALPQYKKYFGKWVDSLISQSFFPVIFLFFVYITVGLAKAAGENLGGATLNGADDISVKRYIATMALQYATTAAFLIYGTKFASDMSGKAGGLASKYLTAGAGLGIGAAMGTAAFAGRYAGSRGGAAMMKNKTEADIEAMKSTKWGRIKLATYEGVQKASFDPRNYKGVGSGLLGATLGKAAGAADLKFDFGKSGTGGGYQKAQEETNKKNDDLIASITDPTLKAKALASLNDHNVFGSGPVNLDSNYAIQRAMSKMTVSEQQNMIAKATGDATDKKSDKYKLIQASQKLGKSAKDTDLTEMYKDNNADPKKQALFLKNAFFGDSSIGAHASNPQALEKFLKSKTVKERFEMEKNSDLDPATTAALIAANKKIEGGLNERQKENAINERKTAEKEEETRADKRGIKEAVDSYDKATTSADKDSFSTKIRDYMKNLQDKEIANMDNSLLTHEATTKHLNEKHLEILGKSGTLTQTERLKIMSNINSGTNADLQEYIKNSPLYAGTKKTGSKP